MSVLQLVDFYRPALLAVGPAGVVGTVEELPGEEDLRGLRQRAGTADATRSTDTPGL
ncbi:MAG: hypothetical protein IPI32_05530 [Austwickia sp.]|nr:hypothetical protein [Austwickia sp.]MBK8435722.1 hypothetical protein [Austwickia sp.]MBK9100716.1 hypothetical protein [Austwickia sp.]